jgi:hypothetical protein
VGGWDAQIDSDAPISSLSLGAQVTGVNNADVKGLNPSQLASEIAAAVLDSEPVTLRVVAHSYPSVVAVLPNIASLADKQRLEQAMLAVSLELKQRSIPLSTVPINAAYALAFPKEYVEDFQRLGLPAIFVDFDLCGNSQALLDNLSPGKLAKFLRLGEPRTWDHTVTLQRSEYGFGIALAATSVVRAPTSQDEVIVDSITADSEADANPELFHGWQVLAINGSPTCRANFQVLMRGVDTTLVLSLRPNDALSPRAQAHLSMVAKQAVARRTPSALTTSPSAIPFGTPLSAVFGNLHDAAGGDVEEHSAEGRSVALNEETAESVDGGSVAQEAHVSDSSDGSECESVAADSASVAATDTSQDDACNTSVHRASVASHTEPDLVSESAPMELFQQGGEALADHAAEHSPSRSSTPTSSIESVRGDSAPELALPPPSSRSASSASTITSASLPPSPAPTTAAATPITRPQISRASRKYATEDERVHAEADVGETAARMEDVTFDFTFG